MNATATPSDSQPRPATTAASAGPGIPAAAAMPDWVTARAEQDGAPARRSRSKIQLVGWSITVIAVLIAVAAGLAFFTGFQKISGAPHVTAPGAATFQLDAGPNAVYENDEYAHLDPGNVQVIGPDGRMVPVRPAPVSMSIGINDTNYTEIAAFDAPSAGSYVVVLGGSSSFVTVAPDISPALLRAVLGGAAAAGCFAIGAGIRRFGRRKEAGAMASGAPTAGDDRF